jgi:putative tryptophan/tyrosine transport system substrate-binding protein
MRSLCFRLVALATLAASGFSASPANAAPDSKRVWKVGILWHAGNLEEEAVMFGPLSQGMRELGYVEGRNVVFEHTFVDEKYELFPSRAQDLLNRKVDVILASVGAAALAASKLTKDVPIVFATSWGDPAKAGLVESIRRPGGNLTGLTLFAPEMTLKNLELLREIVPNLSRIAVLYNPSNDDHPSVVRSVEQAAKPLNLEIVTVGARGPEEFATAFSAIEKANAGGMIVLVDSMLRVNRKPIVDFAADRRLPAIYATRDYVEAGGLMGYGTCVPCNFKQSAKYIADIFNGAKPAEMPVEQPAKFDILVNLKTAKALNITIPPSILLRADDVIE